MSYAIEANDTHDKLGPYNQPRLTGCGHPGGRAMGTCPVTWPAGSPRPVAAYCRADGGAVPTTLSPNVPPPASLYSPGWDADEVSGGSVGVAPEKTGCRPRCGRRPTSGQPLERESLEKIQRTLADDRDPQD